MKRMLHSLAAVFTVLLLTACGSATPQNEAARDDATLAMWSVNTSSDEARQQLTDGVRQFDMNRPETAYEHFKRAIAADPNLALAEVYASFAATTASTLEQAFKHLDRATELAKQGSEVDRLIVSITRKNFDGDDDGALADAQQLVKVDPNGARSWDYLAFTYDQVRDRVQARAARDKAISLAGYAGVYMTQSFSYAQAEPFDFAKAEEYARKAVELEPNDEGPYDILGDALRAQGKLEEAAQAYTRCAELDPTRGDALQQRAHVQTFLGRYAEARADYDAAVALAAPNRKPTLGAYRAFAHLFEGNPKAAVEELEKIYASIDAMETPDPVSAKQFILNAAVLPITVYHRMIPEAQSAVERQKQLGDLQMQSVKTPEFQRTTRAFNELSAGYLAYAKGDYTAAQQKAQEYMKIREPDRAPTKNAPAHVLLGYIALAQNRPADAVAEFEQGNPDNILMNFRHAQALEALGRTAEAQKWYGKIANFYFNPVEVGLVRNATLAKVKKPAA